MKLIIENGPILRHVTELHSVSGLLTISFFTPHAATIAHLATGWPFHGDRALEINGTAASIIFHPLNDLAPEPTQHDSWALAEDDAPVPQ